MTVGEFIDKLSQLPGHAELFVIDFSDGTLARPVLRIEDCLLEIRNEDHWRRRCDAEWEFNRWPESFDGTEFEPCVVISNNVRLNED